jgi:hypothetical protein
MNRLLAILLFCSALCVPSSAFSFDLVLTTNSIYSWHADSEDEDGTAAPVTGFRRSHYVFCFEACMNPSFTNEYYNVSRSGETIDLRLTNDVPEVMPAVWGYRTNAMPIYSFSASTSIGSLSSNQIILAQSNMCQMPTNMSVGNYPLQSQSGILASRHINWIIVGASPDQSANGDPVTSLPQNDACVNAGNNYGFMGIDLWRHLSPFWSNAIAQGNTNWIGFFMGTAKFGHIEAKGSLSQSMAVEEQLHGTDTNIACVIIDWIGQSVTFATNATASSISRSGNTLTFNLLPRRMPGAWDNSATDPTNNANLALTALNTNDANAFRFSIGVSNCPAGIYSIKIGGTLCGIVSSTDLTNGLGWNMVTNTCGPFWAARAEVLRLIRVSQDVDTTTLVEGSAGDGQGITSLKSTGFSFWSGGDRGDTLIADLDPKVTQLKTNWTAIAAAAQPPNSTVEISQIITSYWPGYTQ